MLKAIAISKRVLFCTIQTDHSHLHTGCAFHRDAQVNNLQNGAKKFQIQDLLKKLSTNNIK